MIISISNSTDDMLYLNQQRVSHQPVMVIEEAHNITESRKQAVSYLGDKALLAAPISRKTPINTKPVKFQYMKWWVSPNQK